ncbi:MAG: glutamine--fructose-6-phosphate transaminase (isomerizing) [Verrucomicrobiales bacterium]
MCGIVGYIGPQEAAPLLLDGLRRLEYRGYDSAGITTLNCGSFDTVKKAGRIEQLAQALQNHTPAGSLGISHTRWATHGGVTDENAHPHLDSGGMVAVVHNGVIENYQLLKETLRAQGRTFKSQTDTEVLANLIASFFDEGNGADPKARLIAAVRRALQQVKGTYGIAVLHRDYPELLVGARRGSPLVLGVGQGQHFLASDKLALAPYTRDVVYLDDYDLVVVEKNHFEVLSVQDDQGRLARPISRVEYGKDDFSLGDYSHYMLKEIFEQPDSIRDAMRGRLDSEHATAKLGGLNMTPKELRAIDRIILTGCGTAMHAAMVGEYLIESLAHIPVEVEFASEFRYRNTPSTKDTLVFAISQSGETADTLAALRESQRQGLKTLGICNSVGSTIARESDGGVYMHAGPEIGVAATKSFTSQLTVLTLIGLLFGRMRFTSSEEGLALLEDLDSLPELVRQTLQLNSHVEAIAERYLDAQGFLFFGRLYNYPVALEAALKLKEVSYIFAQGHPSAELKHGVIALITPETPSLFIAPDDAVLEKNISNMEEIKARGGPVIVVTTEGCEAQVKIADQIISIPKCPPLLSPILASIPLQLLSYHIAVKLGCDVDKPRNLAKSVTVE